MRRWAGLVCLVGLLIACAGVAEAAEVPSEPVGAVETAEVIEMAEVAAGASDPCRVDLEKWVELWQRLLAEAEAAAAVEAVEPEIWVLVSISEQHLWLYLGEEVLTECDVVTGLANGKRDTPVGEYAIYEKTNGRYLKGQGYKVWVDYWMPFSGGYGLHDANWRDDFGGTLYKKNGSHGCVNMPHEVAAQVYNLVRVGTRVVIEE